MLISFAVIRRVLFKGFKRLDLLNYKGFVYFMSFLLVYMFLLKSPLGFIVLLEPSKGNE